MSTETNERLVRDMFAALSRGDVDGFLGAIADDVVWKIEGTTQFSSTFEGKADVVARLLGPLGAALESGIALTADEVVAAGDRVVVRGRGKARTKTGKPYENSYCWWYRIADGKVTEVREYLDTALVVATFGR
jgi:hypothetical protein